MTYEIRVRRIGADDWTRVGLTPYVDQESAERAARGWGRRTDWQVEVRDETGRTIYNEDQES